MAADTDEDIPRDIHEAVASVCIQQYELLASKGKPSASKQWTPLAGVVQKASTKKSELNVVALGTGSKCIGRKALDHDGWRVNDSHAEVMARRAFKRYLLYQIKYFIQGKQSIIMAQDKEGFKIAEGITFHYFCTQSPCGDASIYPNGKYVSTGIPATSNSYIHASKRKHSNSDNEDSKDCKRPKTEEDGDQDSTLIPDVHRTGGKCVSGGSSVDLKLPGHDYHVTGVLRTKPGRGDPTQSMCCSDKLMRWNYLGCQGALLHHYLQDPVYFTTMTFGEYSFNEEAVQRALITRLAHCPSYQQFITHQPFIGRAVVKNEGLLEGNEKQILHTATHWCVEPELYEVSVLGLKQGSNTKSPPSRKSSVSISKRRFVEEFVDLMKATPTTLLPPSLKDVCLTESTYYSMKQANKQYTSAKAVFINVFHTWYTNDSKYEDFKL